MNIEVGDLVNFVVHARVFKSAEKDYKSPGIVIDINETQIFSSQTSKSALVVWSDGKISREHLGYLERG